MQLRTIVVDDQNVNTSGTGLQPGTPVTYCFRSTAGFLFCDQYFTTVADDGNFLAGTGARSCVDLAGQPIEAIYSIATTADGSTVQSREVQPTC